MTLWELAVAAGQSPLARIAAIPLWSRDPFRANFPAVEPAALYERRSGLRPKPPATAPETLRVMTWNIKYGGARIDFFYDGHGDRILMRAEEVLDHLEALAEKIRQVDPDILLLQEVDRASNRTALIDQVRWLLDHTPLIYGAYASQWRATLIPSRNLGRVDSGVAILSKWPLEDAERHALPLIEEQDAFTQYFFLRRCFVSARISCANLPPLRIICAHTSAFTAGQTKRAQIMELRAMMERSEALGERVVAGGDLNIMPPGSPRERDFEDVVPTEAAFQAADYTGQPEWMRPLYERFRCAIPLETYQAAPHLSYSHSTRGDVFWNRALDYLFSNGEWVEGSAMVHQSEERGGLETMSRSDHAPLVAELRLV